MVSLHSSRLRVAVGACALLLAPSALAQFNNQWLTLSQNDNVIKDSAGNPSAAILNDVDEKDYGIGDLDRDGWDDLVIVRKTPNSFIGKRTKYLLMNEFGTLRDRTTQYATASLTVGDTGFNRVTDSRDVELVDLNGDGFLDVIYCSTDLQVEVVNAAKVYTHPRVYMNLGRDANDNWLGLRHEDSRIPQLKTTGGVNGDLRFCDLTTGDFDKDGDLDLYFVDYDTDENNHNENPAQDLNDCYLTNVGLNTATFVEDTLSHMTQSMRDSQFGTECKAVDVNGDGRLDIAKISTLMGDDRAEVIFNDSSAALPNGNGQFDVHQTTTTSGLNQVYTMDFGDLNNDGRIDIAIGDDTSADGYKFNTGSGGPGGSTTWTTLIQFSHLTGSSAQGFPGQMYVRDYNNDGWNDVFVSDVDLDLLGCTRRTQIFHNMGGTPGATNIVIREEKELSGSGGWTGAVGFSTNYPKGVFDIGNIDIDNDGDIDVVLGMCNGTDVWFNQTWFNQPTIGQGGVGDGNIVVGGPALATGKTGTMKITHGPVNGSALLLVSIANSPVSAFGGVLHAFPILFTINLPLDADGKVSFPVPGGSGPLSVYVQALLLKPFAASVADITDITNCVRIDLQP